jgi:hypothetical protein
MGQSAVRQAVANAFTQASLSWAGAGMVYEAPTYISEQNYEVNAANAYSATVNGSGTVVVVNLLGPDKRYRIADTGRDAQYDMNVHLVIVELFFSSTCGEPIQAIKDYDDIVDSVVPYIRENPVLADPATIWSAGEYDYGVVHECTKPFVGVDGLTIFINGQVRFEAWEQIAG